jgi:hypothetical protein
LGTPLIRITFRHLGTTRRSWRVTFASISAPLHINGHHHHRWPLWFYQSGAHLSSFLGLVFEADTWREQFCNAYRRGELRLHAQVVVSRRDASYLDSQTAFGRWAQCIHHHSSGSVPGKSDRSLSQSRKSFSLSRLALPIIASTPSTLSTP